MKKAEREQYENELAQLQVNRSIEKWSWSEHFKRAHELNQVRPWSGDEHFRQANKIIQLLSPIGERIKKLQQLLWKDIQDTLLGP